MRAINFEKSGVVFTKENCHDLPAFRGNGEIISCWGMTFKERLKILFGKPLWLHIQGNVQPPVYISVDYPFSDE